MYKFNDIKEVHIELSSNCQAGCPMCARNFHGGIENPLIKINNIDFNFFKQIAPLSLLQQLKTISLCGNFGDPILNQELIPIVEYITISNPDIRVDIHTNGGARNIQWWENLAKTLPTQHTVHFALDGLADTHSLYRIGTDWNKIIENAKAFISAGGNARWVFLTFKHNEHQLEDCKALAKSIGFESFFEKQTSRFIGKPYFEVLDKEGKVEYHLEQPSEQKLIFIDRKTVENYKEIFKNSTIDCEVKKSKNVYVDANGYVWPCCFVGAVPYIYTQPDQLVHAFQQDSRQTFYDFVNQFGGIENFSLQNKSIQEIIDSIEWQTLWDDSFKDNPLRVCTRTCGKFTESTISQSKDQFLKLDKFNE
jgi:MoaA/NifB/PqqE/SkfB family radical SAM enzyme